MSGQTAPDKAASGLRKGFTTGACAQAAARASAIMLATGKTVEKVDIETASGVKLCLPLIGQRRSENSASCGVVKDAGDDPDITNGAEIYAEVMFQPGSGVEIAGGTGVGRVTRPGLPVPPGDWAINPVPRSMIARDVAGHVPPGLGARVTISVPEGERLAPRTFNPRLGIVGGISILGTTGIVEPRSVEAYKVSLALEIRVARASGHNRLAICPGRIGEAVSRDALGFPQEAIVLVGDHVGFALEACRRDGVAEVVLAGHVGKLAKVAAGMMNTHSRYGDARMETLAACAALCGAPPDMVNRVLGETTAEGASMLLLNASLPQAFARLAERVVWRAGLLVGPLPKITCYVLDLKGNVLGSTL